MKQWILFTVMTAGIASAAPNADTLAICYTFSGDRVLQTGPCIVSSGYGAGGTYQTIRFQNREYVTESATELMSSGDTRTAQTTLNGSKGIEYVRDARWHTIIKGALYPDGEYLYCTKTPNGKTDICVKYQ
ncbi:hypothetical protein [Deinococcus radiophilus]|uniref:Uncharacterized protein n=1 Tax=Deinococcus radiophilus TaxID=32062 RepID=A0A431VTB6_9DEIO|nr:hypothetical protein [Deinococcus radiophilus]RTR26353.1 hypothetical protein EJ104_08410 [Deinococcus radiophilus]UFA51998.1 hypothetical protein LMT64_13475 [Deinococcus radiophilus]